MAPSPARRARAASGVLTDLARRRNQTELRTPTGFRPPTSSPCHVMKAEAPAVAEGVSGT